MENTLENKAKFFAQYWGQKVLHRQHLVNGNLIDLVYNKDTKDKYWLGLKPLSSITDEDAKKLSIIEANFRTSDVYKRGKDIAKWIEDAQYSVGNLENMMQMVDYLRSKGYALPWMGLSVEKQIEYGWIKLEDK